jgi:hypothetical protein
MRKDLEQGGLLSIAVRESDSDEEIEMADYEEAELNTCGLPSEDHASAAKNTTEEQNPLRTEAQDRTA